MLHQFSQLEPFPDQAGLLCIHCWHEGSRLQHGNTSVHSLSISIRQLQPLVRNVLLTQHSICLQVQVMCSVQVGVTEGKLRKWLLSVTAFLANQNGSVAEAIALWQRNVQKEFEGVEECLICYSIVSASDGKLPRMHCKTCSKRFHGTCLYKWFQSSGKSNCPHCQSPW